MVDEEIAAGLAETVQALRRELGAALAAGEGDALRCASRWAPSTWNCPWG